MNIGDLGYYAVGKDPWDILFVELIDASPYLSDTILDRLLELYPDDPSLGSPYGTGNETFGLPVGWKRVASMS